jgi:nicotinamidase-related amidase
VKFPLDSTQLELLLALEETGGAAELAIRLRRDPSVVSRNLQKISEEYDVLKKDGRRWQLTDLGKSVNAVTRRHLTDLAKVLFGTTPVAKKIAPDLANYILIVINAQKALQIRTDTRRNNSLAEYNILRILGHWRKLGRPVIHAPHSSNSPESMFFCQSEGYEFISGLNPIPGEEVFAKTTSSAFSEPKLIHYLNAEECTRVVLVGFTLNECIDASAKQAVDLGFDVAIVSDACAMFDFHGPEGQLFEAARVYQLTLANLGAHFATILLTEDALR